MKEITRIHIAKTAYNIELQAKKELEKYINKLEAYADDSELLQDIEIRITELLSKRGIVENGVVTIDDVLAVQSQLGEPKDFVEDGDIVVGPNIELSIEPSRKLYRDVDSAILGGVLSGIASFFRINPLWTRLAFIVLLMISFGSILLVYVVLWIVVPPANTAAEKLQMNGRAVTLASIRELNENEPKRSFIRERASILRRIFLIAIGLMSLAAAVGALIATVMGGIFTISADPTNNLFRGSVEWVYVVALILAVISGLLLSTLFSITSYSAFSGKFNKRILTSMIVISIAGLVSFGSMVSIVSYYTWSQQVKIQESIKDISVKLPNNFSSVKRAVVDVQSGTQVNYIVSTGKSSISLRAIAGTDRPIVDVSGATFNLTIPERKQQNTYSLMFTHLGNVGETLIIYGPALDEIVVKNGNFTYQAQDQTNLSVNLKEGTHLNVSGSQLIPNVHLKLEANSSLDGTGSTFGSVVSILDAGSQVNLGIIKSLNVTMPVACPSGVITELYSADVVDKSFTYNERNISTKSYTTSCGSIQIGDGNQNIYGTEPMERTY